MRLPGLLAGLSPPAEAYRKSMVIIVNLLCRDVARANDFAPSMRARFGQIDTVLHNTMLKGFTSSGDLLAAHRRLSMMFTSLDGALVKAAISMS